MLNLQPNILSRFDGAYDSGYSDVLKYLLLSLVLLGTVNLDKQLAFGTFCEPAI